MTGSDFMPHRSEPRMYARIRRLRAWPSGLPGTIVRRDLLTLACSGNDPDQAP